MSLQVKLLFGALFFVNVAFFIGWFRCRKNYVGRKRPLFSEFPLGFVVAFFDTLGIGSFAPTTAFLKFQGKLADELIPGTLNVGLNTAAILEMIIMVSVIVIDPVLLMATISSAALGAWIGAGVVNRMPRAAIQLAMGVALLIAGCVFAATNLHLLPGGGVAMTLTGWRFAVAVAVNFVLGALMSVGIGLYAPCMIVVTLLGLHPHRRLSDHDGLLWAGATDGGSAILSFRTLRLWNLDRTDDRGNSGGFARGVRGQAVAALRIAMAGRDRCDLCCRNDAAIVPGWTSATSRRANAQRHLASCFF